MPLAQRTSSPAITSLVALAAALVALLAAGPPAEAQPSPPPFPLAFSGTVTVGGAPAPDGLQIVARMVNFRNESYESRPRTTSGGAYKNLVVGPSDTNFNRRIITFHILAVPGTATAHLGPDGLQASETDSFSPR